MKHWLRKTVFAMAAGAAAVCAMSKPTQAATSKEVNEAVDKAKAFLYGKMKGDNWENVPAPKGDGQADPDGAQWGGVTAVATYALLAAGENPQNGKVAPAIAWLEKAQMGGHYADGIRAQVWVFVARKDPRRAKLSSTPDFRILLNGIHSDAAKIGLYPYFTDVKTGTPQKDWADHSVSQYGVLGMWACEQAGQEVPRKYWEIVDARWKQNQREDGGWGYRPGEAPRGTMTAAGVATLFITQDYLLQSNSWGNCKGGVRNENIERGLAWMDKHGGEMLRGGDHYFYGLYGIERIGVASGRKYFGTLDWYKIGADEIVKKQNKDGSWGTPGGTHNPNGVPDTCFALLFLVRGRAPVILNKLEYANDAPPPAAPGKAAQAAPAKPAAAGPRAGAGLDAGLDGTVQVNAANAPNAAAKPAAATPAAATQKPAPKPDVKPAEPPKPPPPAAPAARRPGAQEEPWNERPRDAANFTHWATEQTEGWFNWQVINLKVSPDDLHDAPIIYIAGSEALNFSEGDINKLREFVEDGGLVLGNADCGNPLFSRSFQALGQKMFPKYEFRDLPLTHPIFTDQNFKPAKWKTKPRLSGMSNGVRELLLLIPEADVGRSWQTRSEKTKPEAYELVENIYLYTISKSEMRYRGDTYIVHADPKAPTDKKAKVARLEVGDNYDPEPGGWRRLANILHNTGKTDVTLQSLKLGEGKLNPGEFKLAHLTGTTKFKLSPPAQKELKDFVAGGGTLVVDAAGGAGEFADAAEAELSAAFGGSPGALGMVLDPASPLYNADGHKIEAFGYRSFVKGRMTGKLNVPRVRAIEVNGRPGVFYSREDLTAGLVGQPTDGIIGYNPDTAAAIMRNIVLTANGAKGAVAAKPPAEAAAK